MRIRFIAMSTTVLENASVACNALSSGSLETLAFFGTVAILPPRAKNMAIYLIENLNTGEIKVGKSKAPHKRIKQLQTGSSSRLRLVAFWHCSDHFEKLLHWELKDFRSRHDGEWFTLPVDQSLELCQSTINQKPAVLHSNYSSVIPDNLFEHEEQKRIQPIAINYDYTVCSLLGLI